MRAEFETGWILETMHLPDRKLPVLAIWRDDGYQGHAVFHDECSREAFEAFMVTTWGTPSFTVSTWGMSGKEDE